MFDGCELDAPAACAVTGAPGALDRLTRRAFCDQAASDGLTRLVKRVHALNYFIFVTGDRLCIYLNQGSRFYSSKQGRVQYSHGGCDMVKMRQPEEIHGLRCARVPVVLKYSCIRPFISGLGMSKWHVLANPLPQLLYERKHGGSVPHARTLLLQGCTGQVTYLKGSYDVP